MTPEKLTALGEKLFGTRWRKPLATFLGRSERTVRRWAAGKTKMPKGLGEEIVERLTHLGEWVRQEG